MSEIYESLLNATIDHVQSLKKGGAQFLTVSPETLRSLQKPAAPAALSATPPAPQFRNIPAPAPAAIQPLAPIAPLSVADQADKEAAMEALILSLKVCSKCPNLVQTRKNVVFGVGDIHSPLMFVGEAPGADEDLLGEPFVGAAGQLLTKIIQAMGFTRQSVYIANILKCRPDTPGQSSGNRKPTAAEMDTCLPYLLQQIDIIKPRVIVALGATAIEGLLGKTEGISRLRGHFRTYRGIPLMPTFHPAYLLRNQAVTEKRKVWEDMLQVMEILNVSITPKQRAYFLR